MSHEEQTEVEFLREEYKQMMFLLEQYNKVLEGAVSDDPGSGTIETILLVSRTAMELSKMRAVMYGINI